MVAEPSARPGLLGILGLSEVRRYVRRYHAGMMAAFFAILYAIGSMALGGMLLLARVPGGYTLEILWGNALGQGPWNYPGLLLVAPWGVVSLPFLATISMIVVSAGVGLGIAVAILISAALLRNRRATGVTTGAVGSIAGLTPAMIALVTLGACCSSAAAATAGVGLVAQASGSSVDNLLVNNWYLDVFQMSVVFVSLLAQELLLRVYGGLFGLERTPGASGSASTRPAPVGWRWVAGGTLRVGLLLAGVSWALAMLAAWTTVPPTSAGPALWFNWLAQHQLVSWIAIVAALFPGAMLTAMGRGGSRLASRLLRALAIVAGVSLAVGTPPILASAGAPGFVNELLFAAGAPATWGAVPPVFAPGWALALRWALQYLLLGGFAIALGLSPSKALEPIRWTVGEGPMPKSDAARTSAARSATPLGVTPGP